MIATKQKREGRPSRFFWPVFFGPFFIEFSCRRDRSADDGDLESGAGFAGLHRRGDRIAFDLFSGCIPLDLALQPSRDRRQMACVHGLQVRVDVGDRQPTGELVNDVEVVRGIEVVIDHRVAVDSAGDLLQFP